MDFDAGQPTRAIAGKARQPLETRPPYLMRNTMHEYRVQTWIRRQHLKKGTRRRIAVKHNADVFPQPVEHWNIQELLRGGSMQFPSNQVNF
jgi:hypothetical protein